jgi:hypothetical protein
MQQLTKVHVSTPWGHLQAYKIWYHTNINILIIFRTQHSGAKLRHATINKATCFDPLGSTSGL